MKDYVQVLTTVASEQEAQRICDTLLENQLAACVQVAGPVSSIYRWQGRIEREQEWQCLAKTTLARYPQVEEAIRAEHSYDEPEIVATPILAGSAGYLAWISDNVGE